MSFHVFNFLSSELINGFFLEEDAIKKPNTFIKAPNTPRHREHPSHSMVA